AHAQSLPGRFVGRLRPAQVGTHIEQVVLDAPDQFGKLRRVRAGRVLGQQEAQHRVQLVHAAVGGDARVVLGDAAAVPEGRLALVAGLRVNAREIYHESSSRHDSGESALSFYATRPRSNARCPRAAISSACSWRTD